MNNYLLKNAYLYNQGIFQKTDILVKDGYIEEISSNIENGDMPVIDLQGKLVSHNFIDIHTHILPGLDDGAGDIMTALRWQNWHLRQEQRSLLLRPTAIFPACILIILERNIAAHIKGRKKSLVRKCQDLRCLQ